ncbi:MAG TPA: Gfo/Idh/MocA family oxidoreductase [Chloroflexota bacterium]|nr:Gfo/Idh/MocA family oxidoreductase [Chloroflexota bacterium]
MARINHDHLRVAVVGAGHMANRVHFPSLASFSDVTIAGVCDLDPERLQQTADQFQIEKRYRDYRQMVEEIAPDAIYVIGQPHYMYDVWVWCLEHGLNLYVEKPLGLTLHQARMLVHLAEKHGSLTQVSFQRRTSPLAVKLRSACLERGSIVHAVCRFYKSDMKPMLGPRDHVLDDSVHAIDTLRWLCGGEVVGIASATRRIGVPDLNFVAAMLDFDNGATGILLNSWSSGRRIFDVEMHAPGVCAEADLEGVGYLYADGDTRGTAYDAREVAGGDQFHVFGGFQAKHREFVDCLKSGQTPGSSFADALKTMTVAEKILAQSILRGD